MSEPELARLPEWVKSLGLPPEAVAAIDRWWKPVWERSARSGSCRSTRTPAGAEQLDLEAVDEPRPGAAWRERFQAMWPTYRTWYLARARPRGRTSRPAAGRWQRHMPELVPTYERLVELAGGDELAARLLSLYRPPGFIVGCSQGAWTRGEPLLVRNYDYPVARLEGVVCLTRWGERRVLGMSDCLWGLLDGINDSGLAISLTFGGRRDVGDGFAIPLVVRYLLETCDTVAEARRRSRRSRCTPRRTSRCWTARAAFLTAYVGPGRAGRVPRRSPPRPTTRAGSSGPSTRARSAATSASAACSTCSRIRTSIASASSTRSSSRRCTTPNYALGIGHDLHRRLPPRRGPGLVPLAGSAWEQSFDDFAREAGP